MVKVSENIQNCFVSCVAVETLPQTSSFEYIAVHDVFVNLPAGLASFPLSLSLAPESGVQI